MKFKAKNKALFFIVGILVIISLNFFQTEVKSFFYSISQPIQQWLWQAGQRTSDFFGTIPMLKEMEREREALELKNRELMAELVALKEAREENIVLREALEVGLAEDFRLQIAEVIGKDLNQDTLIINIGSQDGIEEGMPVITSQKVVLGRISQVFGNYSKVMLISNKGSSFDAEVPGASVTGVVKGKGSGQAYIDLLPKEEEIAVGELIISSSLGGVFPSGLLVGLIEEVRQGDVDPFQQAEISIFFDLSKLERVFIILNF